MLLKQVVAICWAQFRTTRNHLPRRSWGAILGGLISVIWYGMATAVGVGLALYVPAFSRADVAEKVPMILSGIFLFWQLGPLFTLSSGWSLQLNKLLMYPIPRGTLFLIEFLLRLTTAPEMIPVLLGLMIGLLRHGARLGLWPLTLLLFIPLNLLLSLAVRELVLHSFERNRFRELFTVLLVSIGLLPQLILRGGMGERVHPYFLAASNARFAPWAEAAHLSMGLAMWWEAPVLLLWLALAYFAAKWLFARALNSEEMLRAATPAETDTAKAAGMGARWAEWPRRIFADPLAALVQKELQSLIRMPRFRVTFGMACVFSVLIFLPLSHEMTLKGRGSFISNNFLVVVTLYGLLILSDALLLNVLGMDRSAAEMYFAAPIPFRTVLYAKNVVAIFFISLQAILVMLVAALAQMPISPLNFANAIGSAVVVAVFFLAVGNICSVTVARPVSPTQTFRRQAGGKIQLWLLLCSVGMFILVGSAQLAQWAVGAAWAGFAVLGIEFAIGLIVYYIALDSAVTRGVQDREKLLAALSKSSSPIGAGT